MAYFLVSIRGSKDQIYRSENSLYETFRLSIRTLTRKGETINVICYCVLQTSHFMDNARLTVAHGQHLTGAARLKQTGHEKQVAVRVKIGSAAVVITSHKNEILEAIAQIKQEAFMFRVAGSQ